VAARAHARAHRERSAALVVATRFARAEPAIRRWRPIRSVPCR
jgi:hypothetical protein